MVHEEAAKIFEARVYKAAEQGAKVLYDPGRKGAVLPPIDGFCLVVYQKDGDTWYVAAAQCMMPPPMPQQ